MAKEKNAVEFKNEELSSFAAEVNAWIPYMMGKNAKLQMKRDPFLTRFIPKITVDIMKKIIPQELLASKNLHLENLYDMEEPERYFERLIYEDTRLLSQAAETSIEGFFNEWQEEVENLNKLKIGARGALDLIAAFSENIRNGGAKMSPERRAELLNDIKILDSKIAEGAAKLRELSAAEKNQVLDIRGKMANRNRIRSLSEEIIDYKISKNLNKSNLAADGCFDFLDPETAKTATKDTFISGYISNCQKLINKMEDHYMNKYNMVPACIKTYGDILKEVPHLCRESNPNTLDITAKYESGIVHYVSLLEDGPTMILQITRLFPELVKGLDRTISIFEKKIDDVMNAVVSYKDENDVYRGRHRFPFDMSNILANEGTYHTNRESDLSTLMIYGPPGIGKTAGVTNLVKDIGYNTLMVSMPAADLSLFAGLTAINKQNQVIQTPSANLAPAINNPGIIVIDEATSSTDNTVPPQLARFLQLGEVAQGRKIHPLTTIVLLANDDVHHNPNIKPLSPILLSRIMQLRRKDPNKLITDWISYIIADKGIQNDSASKAAYDLILSFLTLSDNGRKYWVQKGSNETKDVSPNFRAWSNLAEDIGAILNRGGYSVYQKAEDIKVIATGIIGAEAAADFTNFYKLSANIPSVKTLLSRMNADGINLTIKDAIRLFDMNSEQIVDTYKKSAMDVLNNSGQVPETEKKTKKSHGEDIRYKLNIKPADTEKYLERLNEYKSKTIGIKKNDIKTPIYTEKDLLSIPDLEKCYNRIWNDKNLEDLKKVALFQISSNIQNAINEEFLVAEKNHRPVDGSAVDNLVCLAMTIPFRESSRGLIAKIMDDLIMPDKTDVLVRYGIKYIDRKNNEIIIKLKPEKQDPLIQAINQTLGKPAATEVEVSEEDKNKTVYANTVNKVIASRGTIREISEVYREMTDLDKHKAQEEDQLEQEL